MKKLTLFCMMAILAFGSCKKEESCPYTDSGLSASTTERAYLASYLSANSIAATEHSSGVFYSDVTPGAGATPEICSVINIKYRGTLIPSGTEFDATVGSASATFPLGKLIVGWQKALPVIKTGGKITLYIPPSLGYGPQNVRDPQTGAIVIPGDSYLKFEIELLDVQ
jgi:FKBP-type peptidyl-prolyl cis-trans isomerase FkpA